MLADYSSGRVLLLYLLRTQSRTMAGVPGDFSRLCALMQERRADQTEELYRDRIKAIKTFRQQNYDIQEDVISQVLMAEEFQNNFSAVKTKGDGNCMYNAAAMGIGVQSPPSKSEISSLLLIFSGCTARFVFDLVGHPQTGFLRMMLISSHRLYKKGHTKTFLWDIRTDQTRTWMCSNSPVNHTFW